MAPMSEIYGRYPVFNIANILFILGVILGAVSQTTNLFIFSRFLTGFAVASNVLNPAIIGDIYVSESRGSGMSLLMLAPLVGGTVGPAIGGVLAEKMGWRTILWLCAGVAILCEVLFFAYLRETYKVTILQRKAARLREEMNDDSLKCAWEVEDGGLRVWWQTMRSSFARPLVVMWSSGVLKVMSFYGGFVFTFYYIMATSLSGILKDNYGFSPSLTGSAFIFFSKSSPLSPSIPLTFSGLGAIGGILVCNKFIDRIYINLGKTHSSTPQPEYRLPFMIVGAVCLPPVIWLYGWAPDSHWPVWLLFMSVGLSGVSLIICSISLSSYIVDAFGLYSASAMTMILLVRCLMGTLLPLAIPPLTEEVGLGYAFLILAAACVAVIPLPIVMMRYGRRWRQKSAFTRDD